MKKTTLVHEYIEITRGLRGFFAVHVGVYQNANDVNDTYQEPIQTGFGSYKTSDAAIPEAQIWADDLEIPFVPPTITLN